MHFTFTPVLQAYCNVWTFRSPAWEKLPGSVLQLRFYSTIPIHYVSSSLHVQSFLSLWLTWLFTSSSNIWTVLQLFSVFRCLTSIWIASRSLLIFLGGLWLIFKCTLPASRPLPELPCSKFISQVIWGLCTQTPPLVTKQYEWKLESTLTKIFSIWLPSEVLSDSR